MNDEELRSSMHQLAVKDWYTDRHANWDISDEVTNNLFMPDARGWKTKPGSTPSSSQGQPATAAPPLPAVAATKDSPTRPSRAQQSPAAGPLPSSSSQAGASAKPQGTGLGKSQAPVAYNKPSLAAPMTRQLAGPRPLMRELLYISLSLHHRHLQMAQQQFYVRAFISMENLL